MVCVSQVTQGLTSEGPPESLEGLDSQLLKNLARENNLHGNMLNSKVDLVFPQQRTDLFA